MRSERLQFVTDAFKLREAPRVYFRSILSAVFANAPAKDGLPKEDCGMRNNRYQRLLGTVLLVTATTFLSGCAVVAVTSTAVSVATTTVGLGISAGTAVVKSGVAVVDAVVD